MKPFVLLIALAALLIAKPAGAVAMFAGGKPVLVQEDYVFLYQEPGTNQVHVLYAARAAPAFPRVQFGFPTPTAPTIERVVIDLPEALHKLVAPHEMRLGKLPPAPPAPWIPAGARFDSYTENRASAEHVFDAVWTKSYVDKGYFIAGLGVVTDDDGRVEVVSPSAHISFASERLVFARREPPLASPMLENTNAEPDKPFFPVEVMVTKVDQREPQSFVFEPVARLLQAHPQKLIACQERFLEQKPNTTVTLEFATTFRPRGDVVDFKSLVKFSDVPSKTLNDCVGQVLQKQRIPTASQGFEVQWRIVLRPPRLPARRTHILTIGPAKYIWPNLPASVRLEHDFEILSLDAKLAIPDIVRKAIHWTENQRVWVSHWVDKSARRVEAEDVIFEKQELPNRGEPGALPIEPAPIPPTKDENVLSTRKRQKPSRPDIPLIALLLSGLAITLAAVIRELRAA